MRLNLLLQRKHINLPSLLLDVTQPRKQLIKRRGEHVEFVDDFAADYVIAVVGQDIVVGGIVVVGRKHVLLHSGCVCEHSVAQQLRQKEYQHQHNERDNAIIHEYGHFHNEKISDFYKRKNLQPTLGDNAADY